MSNEVGTHCRHGVRIGVPCPQCAGLHPPDGRCRHGVLLDTPCSECDEDRVHPDDEYRSDRAPWRKGDWVFKIVGDRVTGPGQMHQSMVRHATLHLGYDCATTEGVMQSLAAHLWSLFAPPAEERLTEDDHTPVGTLVGVPGVLRQESEADDYRLKRGQIVAHTVVNLLGDHAGEDLTEILIRLPMIVSELVEAFDEKERQ